MDKGAWQATVSTTEVNEHALTKILNMCITFLPTSFRIYLCLKKSCTSMHNLHEVWLIPKLFMQKQKHNIINVLQTVLNGYS